MKKIPEEIILIYGEQRKGFSEEVLRIAQRNLSNVGDGKEN